MYILQVFIKHWGNRGRTNCESGDFIIFCNRESIRYYVKWNHVVKKSSFFFNIISLMFPTQTKQRDYEPLYIHHLASTATNIIISLLYLSLSPDYFSTNPSYFNIPSIKHYHTLPEAERFKKNQTVILVSHQKISRNLEKLTIP